MTESCHVYFVIMFSRHTDMGLQKNISWILVLYFKVCEENSYG